MVGRPLLRSGVWVKINISCGPLSIVFLSLGFQLQLGYNLRHCQSAIESNEKKTTVIYKRPFFQYVIVLLSVF